MRTRQCLTVFACGKIIFASWYMDFKPVYLRLQQMLWKIHLYESLTKFGISEKWIILAVFQHFYGERTDGRHAKRNFISAWNLIWWFVSFSLYSTWWVVYFWIFNLKYTNYQSCVYHVIMHFGSINSWNCSLFAQKLD